MADNLLALLEDDDDEDVVRLLPACWCKLISILCRLACSINTCLESEHCSGHCTAHNTGPACAYNQGLTYYNITRALFGLQITTALPSDGASQIASVLQSALANPGSAAAGPTTAAPSGKPTLYREAAGTEGTSALYTTPHALGNSVRQITGQLLGTRVSKSR